MAQNQRSKHLIQKLSISTQQGLDLDRRQSNVKPVWVGSSADNHQTLYWYLHSRFLFPAAVGTRYATLIHISYFWINFNPVGIGIQFGSRSNFISVNMPQRSLDLARIWI